MKETILSAGIDIGTSTTQLVFSELTIENKASSYVVPNISIVDKKIVFQSNIHMTPLKSLTEIDADATARIIRSEYQNAGIQPSDVKTGAVIITGETARKQNANEVLSKLSDLAGDFVVATAGPDLESVLAAKGAGTDCISKEKRMVVVNLDIGGGTTNLALFEQGRLKGTSCIDIGGRLIKIKDGVVNYIYPKIKELAEQNGICIKEQEMADEEKLYRIGTLMADQLFQALHLQDIDDIHKKLYTNQGEALPLDPQVQAITFSGGVAKCMQENCDDSLKYGDIGILLAKAIKKHPLFESVVRFESLETIRATVVGAGSYSTQVSGSTISYARGVLPLKNIPVLKIDEKEEQNVRSIQEAIQSKLPLFYEEQQPKAIVIALKGDSYTSYQEITELADAIIDSADRVIESEHPLIISLECDIGKVLGQTLNLRLKNQKNVICIDGISIDENAYLDIGEPLAKGQVLPVVVKTLIFNT